LKARQNVLDLVLIAIRLVTLLAPLSAMVEIMMVDFIGLEVVLEEMIIVLAQIIAQMPITVMEKTHVSVPDSLRQITTWQLLLRPQFR